MLTLHIDAENVGIAGAVALNWCLDRDTALSLAGRPAFLLITVLPVGETSNAWRTEMRQVVPLTDPMAYVSFKRAGQSRVFARLLTGRTLTEWKDEYLAKDSSFYQQRIVSHDGVDFADNETRMAERIESLRAQAAEYFMEDEGNDAFARAAAVEAQLRDFRRGAATLDVLVPETAFGRRPTWDAAWVNWLHLEDAVDQCEYRRRRYVLALPKFALLLLKFVCAVVSDTLTFVIGARRPSFGATLHPLSRSFPSTWFGNALYWIPNGGRETPLRFPLVFLTPAYLAIMALVTFDLLKKRPDLAYWEAFLRTYASVSGGIVLLILAVAILLFAVMAVADGTAKSVLTWMGRAARKSMFRVSNDGIVREDDVSHLVCDAAPKPLRLGDVAGRRKTVVLRFKDLKAQVCKPFQS